MLPSKREASARSEDLCPLSFCNRRRTERSVQTCGRQNALSSALYSSRVARLQDQVDRLQQRNVEEEEEHRVARQSFQSRLQQLHESWQDCFDRHQQAWSREKALAESAWAEERHHLQAQIMQLTSALTGQPCKELMEDAAVQAGSMNHKSRSSQTPCPSTPNPTRSTRDGVWDLLRTQSLPSDSQEWLGAFPTSEPTIAEFATAAAEYAFKVAEGPRSAGDYSQAASSFARAAALYAQGISESAPITADSCLSSSSSDTSEETTPSQFFPLYEQEGKPGRSPVPDQSWWEEFGEWESASKVSHLTAPQHVTCPTQPRLVCGQHIVRLPIARSDAILPYDSFPEFFAGPAPAGTTMHSIAQHDALKTPIVQIITKPAYMPTDYSKWDLLSDCEEESDQAYMPPHSACYPYCGRADNVVHDTAAAAAGAAARQAKAKQAVGPATPTFTGSIFTSQESLVDNDNIWDDLQQAADMAGKLKQPDCKGVFQESEALPCDLGVQKARFPSPSSAPWGLPGPAASPLTLSLPPKRFQSSASNPWGLHESAFPIMDISLAEHSFDADVTYTPVEAFQPLPPTPPARTVADSNIFSGATGCPISFSSSFLDDTSSHVEVMDMSAGDLVSMGGPDSCPWDGTSSATQHSTPSFPKSSMEERFAADLYSDSTAQQEQVAVQDSSLATSAQRAQVVPIEQASQAAAAPAEHSMQSRRGVNSNGLLSVHSTGRKATLDELAGLLLPQSCRVAARVSTKLPPLDHNPMLPALPEGFILPPEMHPVVGTYSTTKPAMSSTASQTAATQATARRASPSVRAKAEKAVQSAVPSNLQEEERGAGKWVHPKLPPPRTRARVVGDLADQAAASMNITTQELLAASPLTELLKDVLSYCPHHPQHDIDLPTFSSRLADSGFMTCQLAQILAPIRAASTPLASTDDAPATPQKSASNGSPQGQAQRAPDHSGVPVAPTVTPAPTEFESSMTAAAVADPAVEARLDAAAERFLAEIGIECSAQTMTRADSDACSEFEMVTVAASDTESEFSAKSWGAAQRLGPAVQLVKTTSATLESALYNTFDSAESGEFYSPRPQSASGQSEPELDLVAMHVDITDSMGSVGDARLEIVDDDSGMTTEAADTVSVFSAASDSSSEASLDDSASKSESYSDSVLSLVSASSFGDEAMAGDSESPDEWEMI